MSMQDSCHDIYIYRKEFLKEILHIMHLAFYCILVWHLGIVFIFYLPLEIIIE